MKLYGVDYNRYICGGIGNKRQLPASSNTVIFYTEEDMLKFVIELKKDNSIGDIKPFTTCIKDKEEYKI